MATTTDTSTQTTLQRPAPSDTPLRRTVQISWKLVGSLFALVSLSFGVYQLVGVLAHEEVTITRTYDAAGLSALEVHNGAGGRVTVIGSDTNQVRVTAEIEHGLRRTGHNEEVVGDTVVLDSTCPIFGSTWCFADYTVEVPRELAVLVRVDSGSIDLSGITGGVDARVDSGSIDLADVSGVVQVDSDSGGVRGTRLRSGTVDASTDSGSVRLSFDVAPTTVQAETDSGSVEVVVPDDEQSYRVDTGTDSGGEVVTVIDNPASDRLISAHTDSGSVTVRYAR